METHWTRKWVPGTVVTRRYLPSLGACIALTVNEVLSLRDSQDICPVKGQPRDMFHNKLGMLLLSHRTDTMQLLPRHVVQHPGRMIAGAVF